MGRGTKTTQRSAHGAVGRRAKDPSPRPDGEDGVSLRELTQYADTLLEATRFTDYCPNGLQVEGRPRVLLLASAVTASVAAIDGALAAGADALLVHHGYFWRGEDPRIVGTRRERLRRLIANDLGLIAYHLPLDVHPTLGNNARLGAVMGWKAATRIGPQSLICVAELPRPRSAAEIGRQLGERLGRMPLAVGALERPIRRIAWCTGGAQDMLDEAIAAGADAFVSGEISERTTHLARESGVVYFSAGHHATERGGVQALGAALARRFGITHRFIDDDNPV